MVIMIIIIIIIIMIMTIIIMIIIVINISYKEEPVRAAASNAGVRPFRFLSFQKAPNVSLPETCSFRACRRTCVQARFRETLWNFPPSSAGAAVACFPEVARLVPPCFPEGCQWPRLLRGQLQGAGEDRECATAWYSLWRRGVTLLLKDVSNETPDVTPCRT